jgi:hypothetical protein
VKYELNKQHRDLEKGSKQEERVLTSFNSQFGEIESSYFRKMPGNERSIFVVVFKDKQAMTNAIKFYYSTKQRRAGFVIATNIVELKEISNIDRNSNKTHSVELEQHSLRTKT